MIRTDTLRRTFRGPDKNDVVAVEDITLTVPVGQTVAVLGPNGAGKSTLMRMLTTLLPPTSGTAYVGGLDVTREACRVRSLIGYVGQRGSAGHTQRARDEVIAQARIHGADRATAARRADELFARFGLGGLEQRRTQEMSGGQRRRLDLAMGLAHDPGLLFLDEPTTGLDIQNRANLWDHIRQVRDDTGMTVVVTTHYLEEADTMAERLVVVDHGRILADGTPHELKHAHVGSHVALSATDPQALVSALAGTPQVTSLTEEGDTLRLQVDDAQAALPRLVARAADRGVDITRASAHDPTLDDVFLALTGRSLRDAADTTQEKP